MATRIPSWKLRVSRVQVETDEAHSISFEVPDEAREDFRYLPGQFLTVKVPSETTGWVARCYSLSSSPHVDDELTITVKRTRGGYASNWLCDHVEVGTTLEVLAPSGSFTPADLNSDLVLFAAGSGVTPIVSIIKSALSQGTGQVHLFYANREPSSVIFAELLKRLRGEHPDRFLVRDWIDAVDGDLDSDQLEKFCPTFDDFDVYMCGPTPFMDAVRSAVAGIGVPRSRIHLEAFSSLRKDPFTIDRDALVESQASTVDVDVSINGGHHTLAWPADVPLTDVLLAAGIDAPFSCRDGECGTCIATITRGSAQMLRNDILDDADIREGQILSCQATPVLDGSSMTVEF